MATWSHDHHADLGEPVEDVPWAYSWQGEDSYKRILVAIDQNPWSYNAITHAVTLASNTCATLMILMVPSYLIIHDAPCGLGPGDTQAKAIADEGYAMLAWSATMAERAGVPYNTVMRWGCTVPTILQVANEAHCDLIVMGAPLKPGWLRFFQPSHAKYVAAHAKQPVLVVKTSA